MEATNPLGLPKYTRNEERFNMISHIVGGGLGLVALLACVVVAALGQNIWGIVSGMVYGFSVIILFTMSSIYHGLRLGLPKKVFRILDHCTINLLIAGTYTPVLLNRFREVYPLDAWLIFGAVWGLAVIGIVVSATKLRRFKVIPVINYLLMGWFVAFRIGLVTEVLGVPFIVLLLTGGALYTFGVLFYALGRKKKYMHSVFHLFVIAASILHSVAIAAFVMT